MEKIFNPVVMAGGLGSRLWPLSRAAYPKQFQDLVHDGDGHSLLQSTFKRLLPLAQGSTQLICNHEHRFLAASQCQSADIDCEILLEPIGRNTAPAVIVAALRLIRSENDNPMLICSSDHVIFGGKSFTQAIENAHELASSEYIVTLGIQPSFPCTGYGYIKFGDPTGSGFTVEEFKEKPSVELAEAYISQGNYLWNSGIFVVRPSIILKEAEIHCSELLQNCKVAADEIVKDQDFTRLSEQSFAVCEEISLDYAVLERSLNTAVVPLDCGWSDVGDFHELWKNSTRDSSGNSRSGDIIAVDTNDCLLNASSRLVATLGVQELAIVETKDSVLVTPLNRSQDVKLLIDQIHGRPELSHGPEVMRPWGSYEVIDSGPNYQVKLIKVNPGARLSLQKHRHRSEHWVVVEGFASVHLDGVVHSVAIGESISIPVGSVHSLGNETDLALSIVEVQFGSYLGEDDIERIEDLYGRAETNF